MTDQSSAAKTRAEVIPLEPQSVTLTPMDMLNRAVAQGSNIDVLEKLMALQERWEKNEARKSFDSAIAEAKAEIKPVVRNREGHNKKKYADFAAIASAVDPILSRHGLSYRFRSTQSEKIEVTCVLSHRAGHSEETTLYGPADTSGNKNAIQAIGSTLTYLQRYSLVQMLGLAAAEDDDGQIAAGNGPISDEQAQEINFLLTATKSNTDAFLKWVGVKSVPDIPVSKYADCVEKLNAKKAAAAK